MDSDSLPDRHIRKKKTVHKQQGNRKKAQKKHRFINLTTYERKADDKRKQKNAYNLICSEYNKYISVGSFGNLKHPAAYFKSDKFYSINNQQPGNAIGKQHPEIILSTASKMIE